MFLSATLCFPGIRWHTDLIRSVWPRQERTTMDIAEVRWPDSLWAAVTPKGPDLPELSGGQAADVVIIGAGFTGLSTALHLREGGVDVAILQATGPGWGASGRNNGEEITTSARPAPEAI